MTINSETRVAGPFEGNDSTVAFPFDFKVFDADEVLVVRATDAIETVLTLGADYSVTLNPDQNASPGGIVTLLLGPLATDSTLTLTSALEFLQPLDLTNQGGFYPRVINNAFDRVTILLQQLAARLGRTLKFPLSDGPVGDLPGRAARAGTVLAFDNATGEPIVGPTITAVGSVVAAIDAINTVSDNIADVNTVADNIADVNTVADNIADVNTVADNITDVTNFSDVYYGPSVTDPTTRRDGSPLQAGDLYFNTATNSMRAYDGAAWRESVSGAITVQNLSGDGVETEFQLNYAPESELITEVFISGIYQQKNTYELGGVGGDILIFSEAPPVGTDNIEVVVSSLTPSDDVLRTDLANPTDPAKGAGLVGFKSPLAGAVASTVKDKAYGSVDLLDFMTQADRNAILSNDIGAQNRTTVTANINAAIATLSALGVKFDLSGVGRVYAVNGTVHIKNKITLRNCQFDHSSAVNDEAVVSMGDPNGGNLVRPGKGIDLYVKTSSTATGVVGYRMDSLVRSSCYRDCFAEMNEKTTAPNIGSRGHIGFQIISTTIANAPGGGVGAYQNYIDGCTALAVHTGFDLRTRGTDVEAAADPQVNGNYLTNCFAYSCTSRALNLGLGAQENICDVRADTFVPQIGSGTRIDVINVLGNYNHVNFVEEIGSRADTQYSVALGSAAIYNEISGSTQNIVSGFLDDSAIAAGKRAKNIVRQTGSGLLKGGRAGSEISMSERENVPAASSTLVLKRWIAPSKCVVTKIMGVLDSAAPTGGSTFLYFGKNGSYTTSNRLSWTDSEAIGVKSITSDASAGTDINAQWVLNEGDTINIAATTPAGGAANVNATFFVRFI